MSTDIATTITLELEGYWREPNLAGLPQNAGLYCVYACTFNKDARPKPTVSISRLLYIGEGEDVRARVSGHELWPTWKKQLVPGQVICISAARVSPETTRHRGRGSLDFPAQTAREQRVQALFSF
jgi:hypothetical protein